MAQKVLGIDLGTNSIGLAVRNIESGVNLFDQLDFFQSVVFESGVGNGKSGEFSYAAERTKHRSTRRLYQARKYRIWATLQLLIDEHCCPMTQDELDRWRCYDKALGLKRQYPVDADAFEQWVKLDFDGDGKPDYTSPYQLRAELMEKQLDFGEEINRFKLGRALYHIAQRRGFKSSKGETKDDQEQKANAADPIIVEGDVDTVVELKKSEEKKSHKLVAYMKDNDLPTVGCAMAHMERNGIRVRNSEYTAVRSQYKEEIEQIFKYQKGLCTDSDLYCRLVSERKADGTIFYRRPLRSQKGNVGECTLEPGKKRCQVSHPDFEDFRAWSLINNIKVRPDAESEWQPLPLDVKQRMYQERFILTRAYFKFEDLRKWLEKELNMKLTYNRESRTINYPDRTSVSGCPISCRLRNILGEDWRHAEFTSAKEHYNKRTGEAHASIYNYEDLWHIAATFDDPEMMAQFTQEAGMDEKQGKEMMAMMGAVRQGYAMLSLKAIRLINRFLHQGLIYTDAVLLAKIPEILGEDNWQRCEADLFATLGQINADNRWEKRLLNIVNNLISQYKVRSLDEQSAYRNREYKLQPEDYKDIDNCIKDSFKRKEWEAFSTDEQQQIRNFVAERYQQFFSTSERDYCKLPKLGDAIKAYLVEVIGDTDGFNWDKLYHPSEIEYYAPVKSKIYEVDGRVMSLRLLDTPTLGSIKNPMALRVMQVLRRKINDLLKLGVIDEDTKIVVETARELNDANMRWAIKTYQARQEDANKEIRKALEELHKGAVTDEDVRKARLLVEQCPPEEAKAAKSEKNKSVMFENFMKEDVKKYRLWLEQGCRCLYTGNVISLADLLDGNKTDIEHTIPRSISFDDSLSNLTVCDSHFNRTVKKKQIPTQLENYNEILLRIEPWMKKVEHLKEQVDSWKDKSRRAADKDSKDRCIRQMHLWRMELDYWQRKVRTFTMQTEDLTPGFRNSQLVDTRIVTKYAYHFLKSAFKNVEVQKGEVTATFRKMLGVQPKDEKKDRSRHSHHAVDATMLTVIPKAARRDEMMQLFYEINDNDLTPSERNKKRQSLDKMIRECHLGRLEGLVESIDANLLADLVTRDRTLEPARRKLRKQGKVVPGKYVQGDSIRCSLHKDSFYGAIKYPVTDEQGRPMQQEGQWVYKKEKDGRDTVNLVMRVPIENFTDEKSLESIVDPAVKEAIRVALQQLKEGKRKKDDPIYMLDEKDQEIRKDKNGRQLSGIRHVRCYAKAGRGYLGYDTALHIKEQTYLSDKEYKRSYHVQNDDNYLCLLYEGIVKGVVARESRLVNYFEVSKLGIVNVSEMLSEPYYMTLTKSKSEFHLSAVIKKGTRMLFWDETPDELADLDREELMKRLYVVTKFNWQGSVFIYLQNHCFSSTLGEKEPEFAQFDSKLKQNLIHVTPNNLNALIEHRDFEIDPLGNIVFND